MSHSEGRGGSFFVRLFHFLPTIVLAGTSIQAKDFMRFLFPFILFMAVWSAACEKAEPSFYGGRGKRPVYVAPDDLKVIKSEPPRNHISESGTIFLKDTLFFILDRYQGVHVFSIRDTAHTTNLAFISIPACLDFTVDGNYLYADSWRDLVVVDITQLNAVRETGRLTGVIQPPLYPLHYSGPFECVDEQKGAVVGWEDSPDNRFLCFSGN